MTSINKWIHEYSLSHQNITNQMIHIIFVPLIYWSIIAFLFTLNVPNLFPNNFNWGYLAIVIALTFYLKLGIKPYLVMLLFSIIVIMSCIFIINHNQNLAYIAVIIFAISWIFQFIGHIFEGKRPSFFKDLSFLLIGPVWVIYKIFKLKP